MTNEITAFFKGRTGVAESVYQYDYGLVMHFEGIPLPPQFDCYFEVLGSDDAIPAVGQDNEVAIPNSCLVNEGKVTLHIPLHEDQYDSEVEYIVTFRVIGRARPVDDDTPAQQTAISRAIGLLTHTNAVVLQSVEAKVDAEVDRILDGVDVYVNNWLDNHPEATTTVQDGAITDAKLHESLKVYVTPEMFGGVGDGEHDDTTAMQSAIDTGRPVLLGNKTYLVSSTLNITGDCPGFLSYGLIRYIGSGYAISISDAWHKEYHFGRIKAEAPSVGGIIIDTSNSSTAYLDINFRQIIVDDTTSGKCIYIPNSGTYAQEIRFIGGRLQKGRYGVYIDNPSGSDRNHYSFLHVGLEGVISGVWLGNNITDVYFYGCRMEETTEYAIETDPDNHSINNRIYMFNARINPEFLTRCYNYLVWIVGDCASVGGGRINKTVAYCNGCWYGVSYDDAGTQLICPDSCISYASQVATYNLAQLFKLSNVQSLRRYIRCIKTKDSSDNNLTGVRIGLGYEMFMPYNAAEIEQVNNKFKLWVKVPGNGSVEFYDANSGSTLWTKTNSNSGTVDWYFTLYYVKNWGLNVEFQDGTQVKDLGNLNIPT